MIEPSSVRVVTRRLTLSAAEVGDARALAAYHASNRAHLEPWEPPRSTEANTVAGWLQRLAAYHEEHRRGSALHLLLRRNAAPTDDVCGTVSLTQISRGAFQACYLGFGLATSMVGQGLMYEALVPVIALAFDQLALHRIMANHLPENLRSARLLRRLGFVVDGYARDYLFIAGSWRDHVLTSLTNGNPVPPAVGAS